MVFNTEKAKIRAGQINDRLAVYFGMKALNQEQRFDIEDLKEELELILRIVKWENNNVMDREISSVLPSGTLGNIY